MDYKFVKLEKSTKPEKKFMVVFENRKTGRTKTIHFGASKYEDYTMHKDPERMELYLNRHRGRREYWGDNGIMTSGWWARWLLWSKPSFNDALKLVMSKLKNAGYL